MMSSESEIIKNAAKFGCASMTDAKKIVLASCSWFLIMSRRLHRENSTQIKEFGEWYETDIKNGLCGEFIAYMANNYSFINGDYVIPNNRLNEVYDKFIECYNKNDI